jgi:hypothetical protein
MNTRKSFVILIVGVSFITLVIGQFITVHPKVKDTFGIIQLIALAVFISASAYFFVMKKDK